MSDTEGRTPTTASGPDWGQFVLVVIAVLLLSLAAVAVPALGGVSVGESAQGGEDPDGPAQLAEHVEDATGEEQNDANDESEEGDEDDETGGTEQHEPKSDEGQNPEEVDSEPDGEKGDDAAADEDSETDATGDDTDSGEVSDTGDEEVGDELDEADTDADQRDEAGDEHSGSNDTETDDETDGDDTQDETPDDEAEEEEDEPVDDEDETDEEPTDYRITFDEEPTPGATVEVTLTADGEPVAGAPVYFNGDQIGTTGTDGTVVGDVPFTETLTVVADPPDGDVSETEGSQANIQGVFAHGAGTGLASSSSTTASTNNGTETTVEMDADTALEIDGPAIPETDVTLSATVNETPIPQGDVLIDGEKRTTTDEDGNATIVLPPEPGNTTIAVERGDIRAEETIEVQELSFEVTDTIPFPGRSVDVELHHGDDPVGETTVFVDGDEAGTTDTNGSATVGLPMANEAILTAHADGATAETTVDGLYRNAAVLGLLGVGALVLTGHILVRRFGVTTSTVRALPSLLVALVRHSAEVLAAFGRRVVDAVVSAAHALERFGHWLLGCGRVTVSALRRACRWLVALPGELLDRGVAALAVIHPIRIYRAIVGALRSLFRTSRERVTETTGLGTDDATDTRTESTPDETVLTLRDLWSEFVRLVRPPRVRTKTPGEVGRYAVDEGFPEPPIRTVVDAFRDTEYGNERPSPGRLERVRSAILSVADDPDQVDVEADRVIADENRREAISAESDADTEAADATATADVELIHDSRDVYGPDAGNTTDTDIEDSDRPEGLDSTEDEPTTVPNAKTDTETNAGPGGDDA
ncbi:protein of unknown function [Halobiforma haloterrestris]|uniref:Protein-glutamine gamma-glutamyltransferase-like C-terminal domain-containing protein n=1 Tax=Natronobacterium haloterrestre TaxID=148448 RepID=A0A1I1JRK3_NATHA|nr:DUF4129 domain-containing protein [Halobiforma haloterrestris]SFC51279.1 protein of unknown function [Halobiforma haloterrestris]